MKSIYYLLIILTLNVNLYAQKPTNDNIIFFDNMSDKLNLFNKSTIELKMEELLNAKTLNVNNPDLTIIMYAISWNDHGFVKSLKIYSNKVTEEFKNMIKNLPIGSRIYLDSIWAKNKEGEKIWLGIRMIKITNIKKTDSKP